MSHSYFLSGEELLVIKNIINSLPEKFEYVAYLKINAPYSCWLSLQEKNVLIKNFGQQNFKLMIDPQLLCELKRAIKVISLL